MEVWGHRRSGFHDMMAGVAVSTDEPELHRPKSFPERQVFTVSLVPSVSRDFGGNSILV